MAKNIKPSSEDSSENVNGTFNNSVNNEGQASLDSLLYDSVDDDTTKETPEETAMYEAFFAEYKDTMAKALASVKDTSVQEDEEVISNESEHEFLISLPKAKEKKAKSGENNGWDEDITLAPEKYEDLSDNAEIFEDTFEETEPDFDLGQNVEKKSDKFQISFSFNGEESVEETENEPEEKKYDPEKPRVIDWAFDFVELFVFTLVAVMILTAFVFKHSIVDGNSMNSTLSHGEHLIISDLFYTPERGDIIVFEDYSTDLDKAVVKRVIGLPGETVTITMNQDGTLNVLIDGKLLKEDYVYYNEKYMYDYSGFSEDMFPMPVGEWKVPENEVFVMGDNRYDSKDSRANSVGTISIDSILGKVILRFAPLDKFGKVE